jgi:hypothetical protein
MYLVYRCAAAHDTTIPVPVSVSSEAQPETLGCGICALPAAPLPAAGRSPKEVAAARAAESAAFDADPAMTLFQWAIDAMNFAVEAHGGLMLIDADLKAGMLGRIDLKVLAFVRHMREQGFPAEGTDCALTYVGSGVRCWHYPRHEGLSGHRDLDARG